MKFGTHVLQVIIFEYNAAIFDIIFLKYEVNRRGMLVEIAHLTS